MVRRKQESSEVERDSNIAEDGPSPGWPALASDGRPGRNVTEGSLLRMQKNVQRQVRWTRRSAPGVVSRRRPLGQGRIVDHARASLARGC